jgi:alpha-mannosidase
MSEIGGCEIDSSGNTSEETNVGMALQELDITIRQRSGRSNANADALSRAQLDLEEDSSLSETERVIATLEEEEVDLPTLQ